MQKWSWVEIMKGALKERDVPAAFNIWFCGFYWLNLLIRLWNAPSREGSKDLVENQVSSCFITLGHCDPQKSYLLFSAPVPPLPFLFIASMKRMSVDTAHMCIFGCPLRTQTECLHHFASFVTQPIQWKAQKREVYFRSKQSTYTIERSK